MGTLTVLRLCSLTHNQLWCTLFLNFSSVWTTVARLFGPHGHFWPMTMSVVHHCNFFGPVLIDTDYCSLGDALTQSSGHHSLALVRLTHTLTLTHFSCFYHINSENKMFACFISFNFSTIQFFCRHAMSLKCITENISAEKEGEQLHPLSWCLRYVHVHCWNIRGAFNEVRQSSCSFSDLSVINSCSARASVFSAV